MVQKPVYAEDGIFILEYCDREYMTCVSASPALYKMHAENLAAKIRAACQKEVYFTKMNDSPDEWFHHYRHMWTNRAKNVNHNQVKPRPWSLELSTVVQNEFILIYSKLQSKQWPHYGLVAQRCKNFLDDLNAGMSGVDLKRKYTTVPPKEPPRQNRFARTFLGVTRTATSVGVLHQTQAAPFIQKLKDDVEEEKRAASQQRQHEVSAPA